MRLIVRNLVVPIEVRVVDYEVVILRNVLFEMEVLRKECDQLIARSVICLLYTSPSPRD